MMFKLEYFNYHLIFFIPTPVVMHQNRYIFFKKKNIIKNLFLKPHVK